MLAAMHSSETISRSPWKRVTGERATGKERGDETGGLRAAPGVGGVGALVPGSRRPVRGGHLHGRLLPAQRQLRAGWLRVHERHDAGAALSVRRPAAPEYQSISR